MRKGSTILYIGDSIGWATNTTLLKGTDLFPWKVKEGIQNNYGACRLINKGIGGSFSDTVMNNHYWLFNIDPPDLILFSIGTNDCTNGTGGTYVSTFQSNVGATLQRLQTYFPNAYIIICIPPRTLDPNRSPYVQAYRDALVTTAGQYNVAVAHLENAWTSTGDSTNIESDNIHPNATGHTNIYNNVIWSAVQQAPFLSRLSKTS